MHIRNTQQRKGWMDVYKIYWNIKFNHGMESINNNFIVEEEVKMIGWMWEKKNWTNVE